MERRNIWGAWGGLLLVGLGIMFLLGQFLQFEVWGFIWPFFILAAGATFFAGMVSGGRAAGGLAVPGAVILTIGLILLVQNIFGIWGTWAYAWGLIIAGAGLGLYIFGSWSSLPDVRQVGRVVIVIGLVLFFAFGILFELGAALFNLRSPGGLFWPIALILAGVYLLVVRPLLMRSAGPVVRGPFAFIPVSSPPDTAVSGADGVAVVEPGQVAGVRQVVFRSVGDMTILQGEREGLEIEANQALRERIRAEMSGSRLVIRIDHGWWDWLGPRYWGDNPLRYTLYVRELESLSAAGLGNIQVPRLSAANLELLQSGAGNLAVHQLNVENLKARQAGLGNIDVDGSAGRQEIELTGLGSYQARGLESRSARIRLSGMGSALVSVSEELDAAIQGAGSIEYHGSPRVSQRVTGLGSIKRME